MKNVIIPAILASAIALAPAAYAAGARELVTSRPAAHTTVVVKPAATHRTAVHPGRKVAAECMKLWKAETRHVRSKRAFLAACESKI
jgi:hypothetical protein